ncbi:MAG: hypothetical protein AAF488_11125 [Planctomycetota bacterium]
MKPSEIPDGWTILTASEARVREGALRNGLEEGHPLYRVSTHGLARRDDRDGDVVLGLFGHECEMAVVRFDDSSDAGPSTIFFRDTDEFLAQWEARLKT